MKDIKLDLTLAGVLLTMMLAACGLATCSVSLKRTAVDQPSLPDDRPPVATYLGNIGGGYRNADIFVMEVNGKAVVIAIHADAVAIEELR